MTESRPLGSGLLLLFSGGRSTLGWKIRGKDVRMRKKAAIWTPAMAAFVTRAVTNVSVDLLVASAALVVSVDMSRDERSPENKARLCEVCN